MVNVNMSLASTCDRVQRAISDEDRRQLRGRELRAHVRDCAGCTAFAAAIPRRTADLRAMAPPLPAVAAGGLLARLLTEGSAHSAPAGAVAAGAAGKAATVVLTAKALAVAAVIATATVGAATVLRHVTSTSRSPARTAPSLPARTGHRSAMSGAAPGSTAAGSHGRRHAVTLPGQPAQRHATGHGSSVRGSGRDRAASRSHGRSIASPGEQRAHGNPAAAERGSSPGTGVGHPVRRPAPPKAHHRRLRSRHSVPITTKTATTTTAPLPATTRSR